MYLFKSPNLFYLDILFTLERKIKTLVKIRTQLQMFMKSQMESKLKSELNLYQSKPWRKRWTKLLVGSALTHISDSADASSHHLSLRYLHRQAQIWYPHMSCVVQQDVLRLAVPVHQSLVVQVFQPTEYLRSTNHILGL